MIMFDFMICAGIWTIAFVLMKISSYVEDIWDHLIPDEDDDKTITK